MPFGEWDAACLVLSENRTNKGYNTVHCKKGDIHVSPTKRRLQ